VSTGNGAPRVILNQADGEGPHIAIRHFLPGRVSTARFNQTVTIRTERNGQFRGLLKHENLTCIGHDGERLQSRGRHRSSRSGRGAAGFVLFAHHCVSNHQEGGKFRKPSTLQHLYRWHSGGQPRIWADLPRAGASGRAPDHAQADAALERCVPIFPTAYPAGAWADFGFHRDLDRWRDKDLAPGLVSHGIVIQAARQISRAGFQRARVPGAWLKARIDAGRAEVVAMSHRCPGGMR
jgi:hypothetical protein